MAEDGDWEYNYNEAYGATITGYTGSDTDVIIPSTIGDNYPVTELDMTFASNHSITSVVVPEGVTSIGSYTFETCESLTSVTLPSTLTMIGETAFARCTSLQSITIPAAVESLWAQVFLGCTNLTEITFLGETAPTVDYDTFSMGTYETEVTCTIYSPDNALDGAFDEYVPEYTTLLYDAYQEGLFYEKLTWNDDKIQVESAIRDGNGVRIDTNYRRKPQVIEYTVPTTVATGQKIIARSSKVFDQSPGYAKFRLEVTSSSGTGTFMLECCWGSNGNANSGAITYLNGNGAISDVNYVYIYTPTRAPYADTYVQFGVNNNSTREKQVKITIFESSEEIVLYDEWGSLSGGYNFTSVDLNNTSQVYSAIRANGADSASSANVANGSYKTRWNGSTVLLNALCGTDIDGAVYMLTASNKKYALPIKLTTPRATVYNSGFSGYDFYNTACNYSALSDRGHICSALTAADGGKPLYIRGSLDTVDGKPVFIPDGYVVLTMAPGYTYIPFGEVKKTSSSSAPTQFYWDFTHTTAYTLDSNGKLTHIDGKPISNGITVSSSAPSGGSDGDIWIQY